MVSNAIDAIRNENVTCVSLFLRVCLAIRQFYSTRFFLFTERLISLSFFLFPLFFWIVLHEPRRASVLLCFIFFLLCLSYLLCTTWSASFILSSWFFFPESTNCSGNHFTVKTVVLIYRMLFRFTEITLSSR